MDSTFERGVVIASIFSILSIAPRHCARLTYFLHPKLRKTTAVPITLKLITCGTCHVPAARRKHSLQRDGVCRWTGVLGLGSVGVCGGGFDVMVSNAALRALMPSHRWCHGPCGASATALFQSA